jgi:homoaconitase
MHVGLATIANMGAEVGATTSTFPYTTRMQAYLHATRRGPVARAADEAAAKGFLSADAGAEYDELIEIVSRRVFVFKQAILRQQDLSNIEPTINGPFTPDLATPLSKFASFLQENGWEDKISASLIGSCTNSSYEDMVSLGSECST